MLAPRLDFCLGTKVVRGFGLCTLWIIAQKHPNLKKEKKQQQYGWGVHRSYWFKTPWLGHAPSHLITHIFHIRLNSTTSQKSELQLTPNIPTP
jgi:hypothetical protein